MEQIIYKFKAKYCEIVATPLCLGNISIDWTVDNIKQTGLNGYVYDFSVDFVTITSNSAEMYFNESSEM